MKKLISKSFLRPRNMPTPPPPYESNCLKPEETFRGCSYSVWIQRWSRWITSGFPSYNPPDDMLFLRGAIEGNYSQNDSIQNIYEYNYQARIGTSTNPSLDKDIQRSVETRPILNRVGLKDGTKLGEIIPLRTAIFCPILTALYWQTNQYEGRILDTDEDLRYAAKKDTDESKEIWALIRNLKKKERLTPEDKKPPLTLPEVRSGGFTATAWRPLVSNLTLYRFESDIFTLNISDKNPYLDQDQMVPGTYRATIEGYFVLIKELDAGTYQLHLGGRGRGDGRRSYQTDAIYEITVTEKYLRRNFVIDVSDGGAPVVPLPPPSIEYSYSAYPPRDLDSII